MFAKYISGWWKIFFGWQDICRLTNQVILLLMVKERHHLRAHLTDESMWGGGSDYGPGSVRSGRFVFLLFLIRYILLEVWLQNFNHLNPVTVLEFSFVFEVGQFICICTHNCTFYVMYIFFLQLYSYLYLYLYLQVWPKNFNQLRSSNPDDSSWLWREIKCQQGKLFPPYLQAG